MIYRLIHADVLDGLRSLPDASVQCVVTSPPYWGLRDYGVAGQLGLERTPDEYVARMVEVFAEVRRVLRDDGTLWLNIGDSYCNTDKWGGGGPNTGKQTVAAGGDVPSWAVRSKKEAIDGIKPKDLVGIPWRLAFGLQADGWYLRSDIIWSKPNPMPESVTDRPTKAHEYLFLLSKSARYFYDAGAIAEPCVWGVPNSPESIKSPYSQGFTRRSNNFNRGGVRIKHGEGSNERYEADENSTRNRRTVWTIATEPFPEAHFATFPTALVEPCILAGSKVGDTILDPFNGSGTTGVVALSHQRDYIGIELNADYVAMARRRLQAVAPMFAKEQTA